MFAIGEFSRLARVTVKALRVYDEMGLLKPARVDSSSGYRYYSASQLPRLNRVLVLKDLGFALEQILRLLERELSPDELRGMLVLRREEQREKADAENFRLANIDRMIEDLSRLGEIMEAVIKMTAPAWAVTMQKRIANYQAVGELYPPVYAQVCGKAAGAIPIAMWLDGGDTDLLAEAGVLLDGPIPVNGDLRCYQLPEVEVASFVHRGSFAGLHGAFGRLMTWIEERGLTIDGAPRELYLFLKNPVRQDDESYVTEIQVPVRKAA